MMADGMAACCRVVCVAWVLLCCALHGVRCQGDHVEYRPSAWTATSEVAFDNALDNGPSSVVLPATEAGGQSGSLWVVGGTQKKREELQGGFQVRFKYRVDSQGVAPGRAFLFALQAQSSDMVQFGTAGTDGDGYGLQGLDDVWGVGLEWTGGSPIARTFVGAVHAGDYSVVSQQVDWLNPLDTAEHFVSLQYDTSVNPPLFLFYLDEKLVLVDSGLRLEDILTGTNFWYGFSASWGNTRKQSNHVLTGLPANPSGTVEWVQHKFDFQGGSFSISCPQLHELSRWMKEVDQVRDDGNVIPPFVSRWYTINLGGDLRQALIPLTPGDVVAFNASVDAGISGCLFQFIHNGTLLKEESQPKCTTSAPTIGNYREGLFDDSAWTDAVRFAPNLLNSTAPYLHLPGFSQETERFWTVGQEFDATIWCRITVPRFCYPGYEENCLESQTCDYDEKLCKCQLPFAPVAGSNANCEYANLGIDHIDPELGPESGETLVTVFGENFGGPMECCFGNVPVCRVATVINETMLTCRSANLGDTVGLNAVILRVKYSNSPVYSLSVTYTYYEDFFISEIQPSKGLFNRFTSVTITGENFNQALDYFCRFGNKLVSATVVSQSNLMCTAPPSDTGTILVEVTANLIDFVSNQEVQFVFYDLASLYCRSFRSTNPTEEFPFVGTSSLLGGGLFFPLNLALSGATINSTATDIYSAPINDGDFCCDNTIESQGNLCGLKFQPIGQQEQIVTLNLRARARINEIITSWNNPCSNMPTSYSLWFFDEVTTNWTSIRKRSTVRDSSCDSFPGDNGPTSFCVDYFRNPVRSGFVESQSIQIRWENNALPDETNGAWLYEVAVHGIFFDYPYLIQPSGFWNSPGISLKAGVLVEMEPLNVELLTIDQSTPTANVSVTLQIALYKIENLGETRKDVSALLTSQTNEPAQLTQPYNPLTPLFSNIFLSKPEVGDYILAVGGLFLRQLELPFSVVAGDPVSVSVFLEGGSELTKVAKALVPIQPVTVCVVDIVGNSVQSFEGPLIVSGDEPLGLLEKQINVTDGCVKLTDLVLNKPKRGDYSIHFDVPPLPTSFLDFLILSGPPAKLTYSGPTSFNNLQFDQENPPTVIITDSAENPSDPNEITGFANKTASASFDNDGDYPLVNFQGATSTVSTEGRAVFPNLYFEGAHGSAYNLTFIVSGLPVLQTTVQISPCEQNTVIRINDPYECVCAAGYFLDGECQPCPINSYSSSQETAECVPCTPGLEDTFGQIGQSECVCDTLHFESTDGNCEDCPTGAICGNNSIIGNQAGYWGFKDSDLTIFLPCYRGSNPTATDIEAAKEACPASDFTEGMSQTSCGAGYKGVRCLVCDSEAGVATSGPFCRSCPKSFFNWLIVIGTAVVLLAMLIFLIYQGRTPKNKESVSTKILLNHVQMLALLSTLGAVWSEPLLGVLVVGGVATFVDSRIVSVDCAFGASYYQKFVFFMLIPFITIALAVLVHLVIFLFKVFVSPLISKEQAARKKIFTGLLSQCLLSVAVVTFLTYPAICIKVLDVFDCSIQVGDKSYLNAAPENECFTEDHIPYVIWAVIMLVVYCIGAPLLAFTMLFFFRKVDNTQVQMPLRFFYDGFKSNRYYWEIVILGRKFLIVLFIIIFRYNVLHQIYGMTFVVQTALLLHILFHPYTSGRQFRLELWSLLAMLISLFVSLFVIQLESGEIVAITVSSMIMVLHLAVVLGFLFFIGRGLMRRFMKGTWAKIRTLWKKGAPERFAKRNIPKYHKVVNFFDVVSDASEYDRDLLFDNLQRWWDQSPNYKRRRLVSVLTTISKGSRFQVQSKADQPSPQENDMELNTLS